MNNAAAFQRLSEIQDEILRFTWEQVGDKVDRFYVRGKVTDDDRGNITSYEGNLRNAIMDGQVVDVSAVLDDEGFDVNSDFVLPRIVELHDILVGSQGKSPVRFRWAVDTKTGEVDSDWTYYDDLTDEEKEDDFWWSWKGDFAWRDQLEAELREQQSRG